MQEVRHDGIRVSTVMPGSVRTGFSRGGDAPGTEWKLAPEDVARGRDRSAAPPGAEPAERGRHPARAAAEEMTYVTRAIIGIGRLRMHWAL